MLTRFDAYTATTRAAKPDEMVNVLFALGDKVRQGRGHKGFKERVSFVARCGTEVGAVSWGGTHGELVMLEAKGERTPDVVEKLRASIEHRCTRVDSCHDVDQAGAFDALLKVCTAVKKANRIKGGKAGDWDDFPEDGRTLYLGASTSPVRLRLYEKGRQPEYRHLNKPDWARIEVQVRPAKEAKDKFSKADAMEVWGAARWSREIAAEVLSAQLAPLPAGTTYRLDDRERALRFMCKQYGAHLVGLHNELGTWEDVGRKLAEMIERERMFGGAA
jgi:hypothetical protein